MSNICDPLGGAYYKSDPARCNEGEVAFERDIVPLTKIRQEIGQARLKPNARKLIPPLLKKLSDGAKPVIDSYTKNKALCENSNDSVACGYAYYYDGFAKLFGSVGAITKPKQPPEHIPLAPLRSGYLVASVATKVDGEAGPLNQEVLFDTGATLTVFAESYFRDNRSNFDSLGETPAITAFGSTTIQDYAVDRMSFSFGKTVFSPLRGTSDSLPDTCGGSDSAHHLIAVVGTDFLLSTSFEVNYTRREMVLHQDVERRLTTGQWDAVPIKLKHFGPYGAYDVYVDIFVNGHPITVALDTGSTVLQLNGTCTDVIKDLNPIGMSAGMTMGGSSEISKTFPIDFKLGRHSTRNEISVKSDPGQCMGNLGLGVLKGYDFMIDPVTSSAYFSANPDRQTSRKFKRCGFSPIPANGNLLVGVISPGSPAESAGLKNGDILVEINGVAMNGLGMLKTSELMDDKPTTTLLIERNGERRKIVIDRRP